MTASSTNTKENSKDPESGSVLLNRGDYITYSDRYDQRFGRRGGLSDVSLKIGVDTPILEIPSCVNP
jgi:hypothetical protein